MGQSSMNKRHGWLVLFAAFASSIPCFAAPKYTLTSLALPDGETYARGINASGQVVGVGGPFEGQYAFVYSDGSTTNLGAVPAPIGSTYSNTFGYAINSSGQVTGESTAPFPAPYSPRAFLYSGGVMTDIGTMGGQASVGFAINNAAQVAGEFLTADGQSWHAFLYSNGHGVDLGTLGGSSSDARAINNEGVVAGAAMVTGDTAAHVYLYYDGAMHDLGFSAGVYAMNDANELTGEIDTPNGLYHAFLYRNGVVTDLGSLGDAYSSGFGIDDAGDVVGDYLLPDHQTYHAFLYSNGAMTDLNDLVNPAPGWVLSAAFGINDAGQIVGDGELNGVDTAFLLTPTGGNASITAVPEPAALGMLALGGMALLRRKPRRGRA